MSSGIDSRPIRRRQETIEKRTVRLLGSDDGFDHPSSCLDVRDSIAYQPNSLAEKDLTKCLVQLAAIDMQSLKINIVRRLPQPLTRDIVLLRIVSELQHNVAFVSRDPFAQADTA